MTSTASSHPVSTNYPVFGIERVAALFQVSVDTAREYVLPGVLPCGLQPRRRLPWAPAEVLAWFLTLPRLTVADRRSATNGSTDDLSCRAEVSGHRVVLLVDDDHWSSVLP